MLLHFPYRLCPGWRRWQQRRQQQRKPRQHTPLAQSWNTKLQWMKLRNEEIVQKKVKLLSAVPVGVHNEAGEDKDRIWYLIHGKMIGYYRDRDTKELIRGNPKAEAFYEYWLCIRRNNSWVLHEIRQENEMDIQEFLN